MSEIRKKILFIVNPFSGVGRHKSIEKHIKKALDHRLFDYTVKYTEAPHHATELTQNAINHKFDIVVAVGGDGTVNEVAKAIVGTDVILGIIPSGSGNGLARHLNISVFPEKAIRVINNQNVKKIDTAQANEQFFVNLAGVGFDALVAKKFAGQQRRGFFKYFKIAVQEYLRYEPTKFTMIVDGQKIKRKALFISFANSDQFGYNTSIAPQAKIDDGFIDISIVKKIPLWKTLFTATLLYSKQINRSKYIEVLRAKEVQIIRKKKTIHLDGEPIKLSKNLIVKVNPSSLSVLVPITAS
jgi:YegS/Rv2252/BmrU family lipid kinase